MSAHAEQDRATLQLRGLYWTVAIVLVLALSYCLAVVLVRHAARGRLQAEVERIRAAGEPITLVASFDAPPVAAEDAMTVLSGLSQETTSAIDDVLGDPTDEEAVTIVKTSNVEARTCFEKLAAAGVSEIEALTEARSMHAIVSPKLDVAARRALLEACLAPHAAALATCREAAERPRVWATRYSGGNARADFPRVHSLSLLLCVSALAAAERGDGALARDELGRVLHFLSGLGSQPTLMQLMLQASCLNAVAGTLERLLGEPTAPRELLELEPRLAAFDPWRLAARGLRTERAYQIEVLTAVPHPPPWISLWVWPREAIEIADGIEGWRPMIELADRKAEVAFRDPLFTTPSAGARTLSWLVSGNVALRALETEGDQCNRLLLARAALRARFEGVEAARTFLATSVDVFTGTPINLRVEPDGTIVMWCSSSPQKHADPSGPSADDLGWRLPPGR